MTDVHNENQILIFFQKLIFKNRNLFWKIKYRYPKSCLKSKKLKICCYLKPKLLKLIIIVITGIFVLLEKNNG